MAAVDRLTSWGREEDANLKLGAVHSSCGMTNPDVFTGEFDSRGRILVLGNAQQPGQNVAKEGTQSPAKNITAHNIVFVWAAFARQIYIRRNILKARLPPSLPRPITDRPAESPPLFPRKELPFLPACPPACPPSNCAVPISRTLRDLRSQKVTSRPAQRRQRRSSSPPLSFAQVGLGWATGWPAAGAVVGRDRCVGPIQ